MRAIDADAFDERVRVAGGMSEEELTEDFKDGVQAVLYMLSNQPTIQPKRGRWIKLDMYIGMADYKWVTPVSKNVMCRLVWENRCMRFARTAERKWR